ncbi:MAG: sensor histidine kinase [Cytophagales bacterium]|nr:sensor histidine kinase [Cytophagales bacterium]
MWILTLLIKILIIADSLAQDQRLVDSLQNQLTLNIDSDLKIDVLNELSWVLKNSDQEKAKAYGLQALQLSKVLQDFEKQATSLNRIGEVERIWGNLNQAVVYFENALSIEREINHVYGIARAQSNLCTTYKNLGFYRKAEEAGLECLQLFQRLNRTLSVKRTYQRLALVYQKMRQPDKAISMLQKKLDLDSTSTDSVSIGNSLMTIGNMYYQGASYDVAITYLNKARDIWVKKGNRQKEAFVYTDLSRIYIQLEEYSTAELLNKKSIQLKDSLQVPLLSATNYNNLALIKAKNGDFDSAKIFYHKSITLKLLGGSKKGLSLSYYNLGTLFKDEENLDSAIHYFQKSLEAKPESPGLKMELYWNLSNMFYLKRDFERSNNFKTEYGIIRDSLDLLVEEAARAKDNFEFEQREKLRLTKESQIKQVQLAKRTQLTYFLIAGLILLSLLFVVGFHYYRIRKNTVISEKNAKINQQQIDDLLKNHELKELGARLDGQEKERVRIARELHDRLGSTLSIAKMHFKSVEQNLNHLQKQNQEQYEKATDLLDQAVDEVRSISNEMISGELYKFGLVQALRSLRNSVNESNELNIKFIEKGFDGERMSYDTEINIYRCIQELLSNTLKHANASEVIIQLIKTEKQIHVQVEDDGIGFDTHRIADGGIGLKNIRARAEQLDAEVNIDARIGNGTFITIDIPLKNL